MMRSAALIWIGMTMLGVGNAGARPTTLDPKVAIFVRSLPAPLRSRLETAATGLLRQLGAAPASATPSLRALAQGFGTRTTASIAALLAVTAQKANDANQSAEAAAQAQQNAVADRGRSPKGLCAGNPLCAAAIRFLTLYNASEFPQLLIKLQPESLHLRLR
jgi:hypothetical protein